MCRLALLSSPASSPFRGARSFPIDAMSSDCGVKAACGAPPSVSRADLWAKRALRVLARPAMLWQSTITIPPLGACPTHRNGDPGEVSAAAIAAAVSASASPPRREATSTATPQRRPRAAACSAPHMSPRTRQAWHCAAAISAGVASKVAPPGVAPSEGPSPAPASPRPPSQAVGSDCAIAASAAWPPDAGGNSTAAKDGPDSPRSRARTRPHSVAASSLSALAAFLATYSLSAARVDAETGAGNPSSSSSTRDQVPAPAASSPGPAPPPHWGTSGAGTSFSGPAPAEARPRASPEHHARQGATMTSPTAPGVAPATATRPPKPRHAARPGARPTLQTRASAELPGGRSTISGVRADRDGMNVGCPAGPGAAWLLGTAKSWAVEAAAFPVPVAPRGDQGCVGSGWLPCAAPDAMPCPAAATGCVDVSEFHPPHDCPPDACPAPHPCDAVTLGCPPPLSVLWVHPAPTWLACSWPPPVDACDPHPHATSPLCPAAAGAQVFPCPVPPQPPSPPDAAAEGAADVTGAAPAIAAVPGTQGTPAAARDGTGVAHTVAVPAYVLAPQPCEVCCAAIDALEAAALLASPVAQLPPHPPAPFAPPDPP